MRWLFGPDFKETLGMGFRLSARGPVHLFGFLADWSSAVLSALK